MHNLVIAKQKNRADKHLQRWWVREGKANSKIIKSNVKPEKTSCSRRKQKHETGNVRRDISKNF